MDEPRKIAVITGTRADYGLLRHTVKAILSHSGVKLDLVVTGAHLSERQGMTVDEIERDGIPIAARLPILGEEGAILREDGAENSRVAMVHSLADAVKGFADTFESLSPDLVVVFGDRYEMFAAAQSALILGLPIAHIAGGERSEGAVDEALRHSITKMAILHLVSAEPYRRRVIQLGELPSTVVTVGAPALDSIAQLTFDSRETVCASFSFDPHAPLFVLTLHAETLTNSHPQALANEVVSALQQLPNAQIVITGANADAGGELINATFKRFAEDCGNRVKFYQSLGQERYLKLLKVCDIVLGNSSSGVIEAPILNIPSVNLGIRQQGRLRTDTVLDCPCEADAIVRSIQKAMSADFKQPHKHPFGSGSPAKRIVEELASLSLSTVVKQFYDC